MFGSTLVVRLEGVNQPAIPRQPHTVRTIIRQQGAMPQTVRKDKIHIDPELLRRLYQQCDGWLQRVHEKLVEEEKIQVSYPTLTRLVRELGLGQPAQHALRSRAGRTGRRDAARHDGVPGEAGGHSRRGSSPACCTCGTRSGGT